MLSLRGFWRRHRRKLYVTADVLGSGYLLYKLYNAHRQRLADLDTELEHERDRNEELIKAQMQAHFEDIQRIADTTTLPHAMHYLNSRIAEELDLFRLAERLMQAKGQSTSAEKLELWDRLKILKHMLFYASEKYHLEDSYSKYIAEHGGRTNAYTSSEHTSYHFDINADAFEEALGRFAQFFINPLMSADATMREIKAVDSENQKNLLSDG